MTDSVSITRAIFIDTVEASVEDQDSHLKQKIVKISAYDPARDARYESWIKPEGLVRSNLANDHVAMSALESAPELAEVWKNFSEWAEPEAGVVLIGKGMKGHKWKVLRSNCSEMAIQIPLGLKPFDLDTLISMLPGKKLVSDAKRIARTEPGVDGVYSIFKSAVPERLEGRALSLILHNKQRYADLARLVLNREEVA